MTVDTSAIGVLVAELMEFIADDYDEDVQIGTVGVVVEVNGDDWTSVRYRCSDSRLWVQQGFFLAAQNAVDSNREPSAGDDA